MLSRKYVLPVVALLVLVAALPLPAQEASIKPNDALILENIPPIPASIAERAARYTDYRTATLYGWNPQKREVLIGTRFADTVQFTRLPCQAERVPNSPSSATV